MVQPQRTTERAPQTWRRKLDRAQKQEFVTALQDQLSQTGAIVVAHYSGLTVAEMTEFRSKMREAGGSVMVAKNRLVKRALAGSSAEGISDLFTGPTVLAFSEDPVAAPKISVEFAKSNEKLVILGGTMGDTVLDVNGVKSLASLPSLDELRGKLVGLLQAPAGKIARVVNTPAGNLARVLQAYADKAA